MTTETALPVATQVAEAGDQHSADQLDQATADLRAAEEAKGKEATEEKKEKTHEEREIARLRRRVDSLTRRLYQGSQGQQVDSRREADAGKKPAAQADTETLSLSQSQLDELIDKRAKELAPEINKRDTEIEHRRAVVNKLAKEFGQEKFDAYASDLNDVFDGLADDKGHAKPAVDAIFESAMPAVLIEYLADPDNADEAEALGRMSAVKAGRQVAMLETKLAAQAAAKPQPSKAPSPLAAVRGGGTVQKRLADLSDEDFAKRRREQIARRK